MRRPVACLVLLSAAGCAYRLVRADAPFGARRIAVVPFAEEEPVGMSADLAVALAERLAAEGVQVVASETTADGVVTGRILATSTTRSPTVGQDAAVPAYGIQARVQAQLSRPNKGVVWSTSLTVSEDFLAVQAQSNTATLETEANRRRALHRIVERLARELHLRLVLADALANEGA